MSAPAKTTCATAHAANPQTRIHHLRQNWPLYLDEAVELGLFMISACIFDALLYDPASPLLGWIPSSILRRFLMGLSMGITAILIIHTPMGKRSGAHFNPAITLAYLRLGKIALRDAVFYIVFQFFGAIAGVGVAAFFIGPALALPSVKFAVTVPGEGGPPAAFAAEIFMAALLMGVVLWLSNRPRFADYTSYCVGALITTYVLVFAPISGFSINPARTTGSAVFAHVWTSVWIYFSAPVAGMLIAAEVYIRSQGRDRILCGKLHPNSRYPCSFLCSYPGHHRTDLTSDR